MDWFNCVIVGSGPAGVAAARRIEIPGTCIIDIGDMPLQVFPFPTLRDALDNGDEKALLGSHFEMLTNLVTQAQLHPKLRASALRFVMDGEPIRLCDAEGHITYGNGSHAVGGMSNVWGAQLLRYTDDDLAEAGQWPLKISELSKYYTDLETHIGTAGEIDDMYDFLGSVQPKMPAVPMVPAAKHLYNRYLSYNYHKMTLYINMFVLIIMAI